MVGNFAIMDSKYMSYIQAGGLDHGAPNWGFPEGIEEFQAQMEAADPAAGTVEVRGLEIANRTQAYAHFCTGLHVDSYVYKVLNIILRHNSTKITVFL